MIINISIFLEGEDKREGYGGHIWPRKTKLALISKVRSKPSLKQKLKVRLNLLSVIE